MKFTTTIMNLLVLATGTCVSQNTAVLWSTFDQGFAIPTSSRTMVKSAAGQAFIGFTQSVGTWHDAGFLVDTLLRGSRGPSGPMVSFRRTYGGGAADYGYSLLQTPDKGFVIAGKARSFQPLEEAYLVKTSENGAVQWQRTFHYGDRQAAFRSVTRTSDGGYAAAGQLLGNGQLFSASYLAKVNANGDTLWTRMYGGSTSSSQSEAVNGIQQTSDGGYILVGTGSIPCPICGQKISIIKTNAVGDTMWTKGFPGSLASSVQLTSDGGYIVVGWAQAPFIVSIQLIKLDSTGTTQWARSFGGLNEYSFSGTVQPTIDRGYIISGNYASFSSGTQAYLIKTNDSGNVSWSRKYFSPGYNTASAATQTFDGGYIISGVTGPNQNVQDAFLLKTNANGDSVWAKIFGGGGQDVARSVIQSEDGGYAFTGETSSFGAGNFDMWLVKGDELGIVAGVGTSYHNTMPVEYILRQNYPNPFNPTTRIEYQLPVRSTVTLEVYNLLGQKITTLVDAIENAGTRSVAWDASNAATGVYFYRLRTTSTDNSGKVFSDIRKMLLIR